MLFRRNGAFVTELPAVSFPDSNQIIFPNRTHTVLDNTALLPAFRDITFYQEEGRYFKKSSFDAISAEDKVIVTIAEEIAHTINQKSGRFPDILPPYTTDHNDSILSLLEYDQYWEEARAGAFAPLLAAKAKLPLNGFEVSSGSTALKYSLKPFEKSAFNNLTQLKYVGQALVMPEATKIAQHLQSGGTIHFNGQDKTLDQFSIKELADIAEEITVQNAFSPEQLTEFAEYQSQFYKVENYMLEPMTKSEIIVQIENNNDAIPNSIKPIYDRMSEVLSAHFTTEEEITPTDIAEALRKDLANQNSVAAASHHLSNVMPAIVANLVNIHGNNITAEQFPEIDEIVAVIREFEEVVETRVRDYEMFKHKEQLLFSSPLMQQFDTNYEN